MPRYARRARQRPRRRTLLARLRPFGLLAAGLHRAARPARSSDRPAALDAPGGRAARPGGEARREFPAELDVLQALGQHGVELWRRPGPYPCLQAREDIEDPALGVTR